VGLSIRRVIIYRPLRKFCPSQRGGTGHGFEPHDGSGRKRSRHDSSRLGWTIAIAVPGPSMVIPGPTEAAEAYARYQDAERAYYEAVLFPLLGTHLPLSPSGLAHAKALMVVLEHERGLYFEALRACRPDHVARSAA